MKDLLSVMPDERRLDEEKVAYVDGDDGSRPNSDDGDHSSGRKKQKRIEVVDSSSVEWRKGMKFRSRAKRSSPSVRKAPAA
jgi:hypothetical protein